MLIRAGFEITINSGVNLPVLCALSPRPDVIRPIIGSSAVHSQPDVPIHAYIDAFGNQISRLTAPPGPITLLSDFVVRDSGEKDVVRPDARQHLISDLPDDVLMFLIPSRYCESDVLSPDAWRLFGGTPEGWPRVQAICDFVHNHIVFGYCYGRSSKTALDAYREGNGVCRDYAHLAVAFCRAMNIPARYCSGYLGDIGVPPGGPMDFCAWFEVYLDGQWFTFDARYNTPRIGRILMVRGRDAADCAMIMSFGPHSLQSFEVWCDELPSDLAGDDIQSMMRVPSQPSAVPLTLFG